MVPPAEVQKYYQIGDVFVSASTSETQGLTYIEAAANGLPLLCRRDECLKDVIRQGINGFTYTCKEDFLQAIAAVTEDGDWRIKAEAVSREIAAGYGIEAFGDSVEKIYQGVL